MLSNERGLTLIEVLGAAVILGVVVVLFMNLFGFSLLATKRSEALLDVRSIAERELHEARVYVDKERREPDDAVKDGFTIQYDLDEHPNTAPTGLSQSEAFTLQAVVLVEDETQWLTVTVSREEE
ncbi:prepilin-type N-terminal cleavage/methylation domain-containing protein [Paenibacillus sp. TRM 82003]|nr:prepilin-type N-terminal cleavage/methylation domain-containing protein [Paenibacillus sp. TRM 82003]